tara:strand:- start:2644 stop:3027 length:384 start_codon:yes stop_codon:yes gene_type:complete
MDSGKYFLAFKQAFGHKHLNIFQTGYLVRTSLHKSPSKPIASASSSLHIWKGVLQEILGEPHALLIGDFESISRSVIWIINLLSLLLSSELSKKHNLSFAATTLMDALKITEIVSVHSKDVVKLLEV